jgi:hypothetical protein
MLRGVDQVGFGGKRDPLQVLERTDAVGLEAVSMKERAIVGGKRHDDVAQVAAQLLGLQPADGLLR